jgi:hypothetical protein
MLRRLYAVIKVRSLIVLHCHHRYDRRQPGHRPAGLLLELEAHQATEGRSGQVTDGDFTTELPPARSNDEISQLTASLEILIMALKTRMEK